MLKEKINIIDKMVYDNFIDICMCGEKKEIENYIKKYNVDVNYDDGYYSELVAERNDIELFKIFIDAGYNIELNNYGVMRLVAHEGYLDLLDYIVNKYKIDCSVLLGTSAYNNYKIVHEYINNHITCK